MPSDSRPAQDADGPPRVLIEASKLRDARMDGVKRYVVGLLEALDAIDPQTVAIDIIIGDRISTLREGLQLSGSLPPPPKPEKHKKVKRGRHVVFSFIGLFVPSIVLPWLQRVLPEWFCRSVLGKAKSELVVPDLEVSGRERARLMLPPILYPVLQFRTDVLALWVRGIFQMPTPFLDIDHYAIVHILLPNLYHAVPPCKARRVVTVHDLSFVSCPQFQDRANRITLDVGMRAAVKRNAQFLSVSEATRTQVLDHYRLAPERVTTVYNGCSADHLFPVTDSAVRERVREQYEIAEGDFLLTLSTIEPRKNLDGAVRAFIEALDSPAVRDSGVRLVIAGGAGWKCDDIIELSKQAGDRVQWIGYVDDADLAALYSSALAFVYPSHYEGFGLPLLEAMRCGTPVLFGNNSSMPEVVGDAGLPVDSADVSDIAKQMRHIVTDAELRTSLAAEASTRAESFTWERAARQTLACYEQVLADLND